LNLQSALRGGIKVSSSCMGVSFQKYIQSHHNILLGLNGLLESQMVGASLTAGVSRQLFNPATDSIL
jgi:hypothetical protein